MNFIDILFYLFFLITPLCNGLYFEKDFAWGALFVFILLLGELLRKDKNLKGTKWLWLTGLSILVVTNLTYFVNGFFFDEIRSSMLIVWGNIQLLEMILLGITVYLRLNRLRDDKRKLKNEIKYEMTALIASTVIIALLSFLPNFYREGRFEGTFYYANVCAMFHLAGIALLYNFKFKKKKKMHEVFRWIFIVLNLYALVRTYSRWVYAMAIIYIFLEFCKKFFKKTDSKKKTTIKAVSLFVSCLVVALLGLTFIKSYKGRLDPDLILHDFKLRQSYIVEANEIIKDYPFGLGYEGYLEHQVIKENKYILRLVHNLPYQIVLNYGVVTFMLLLAIIEAYVLLCFRNKKLFDVSNIILVLMFVHSLLDIDFSFLAIDNLLIVLCMKNLFNEE